MCEIERWRAISSPEPELLCSFRVQGRDGNDLAMCTSTARRRHGARETGDTTMRFMKPVATALAITVGALSFAGTAEAGHRHHHRHHGGGGEAAAAGILGFAAGAILGGALSSPRYYG